MAGTIDREEMLRLAREYRAKVEAQAAENAAMKAELEAADAAYQEGVNSAYE